jgi:hypothetical protein
MSTLRNRILRQHRAAADASNGMHPWGTPDTPMVMPMVMVEMGPQGGRVQQMAPLVTANGAMIPATAPGRFSQVAISGRP